MFDEIINAADIILTNSKDAILTNMTYTISTNATNVTSTLSINFDNKKLRYKLDCYILRTGIICYHYAKNRSKLKTKKRIAI